MPWLARQAWLLREPGSGTRAATDALLTELDIAPLTLMVGSNGAIRESASVGLGVTLISRDAVAAELADGRLAALPVPGTPLHRDWYLVAHPGLLPPRPPAWSPTSSRTAASTVPNPGAWRLLCHRRRKRAVVSVAACRRSCRPAAPFPESHSQSLTLKSED